MFTTKFNVLSTQVAGVLLLGLCCLMSRDARAQSLDTGSFVDVAEQTGMSDGGESLSVSWVDYDGDGWSDLWLGVHGITEDARPRLYLNQRDGTFSEISNRIWANGPPLRDMHGSAWADYDNDGDPDLVQVAGGGGGGNGGRESNYFFVNEGGVLVDRAEQVGLDAPFARGRSPLWLDMDGDGHLDLIQTNHPRTTPPYTKSQLFRQVPGQGFEEVAEAMGFDLPDAAPLAQLGDVTGNGEMDLVTYGFPFPQRIYRGEAVPMERIDESLVRIRPQERHWVADGVISDFDGDLRSDFYLARRKNAADMLSLGDSLLVVRLQHFANQEGRSHLTFKTSGPIQLHSLFTWRPFAQPSGLHIGKGGHESEAQSLKWKRVGKVGDNYIKGQSLELHPGNADNWGLDTSQTSGLLAGYEPESETWTLEARGGHLAPLMIRIPNESLRDVELVSQRGPRMNDLFWAYDSTAQSYTEQTAQANLDGASSCSSVAAGDFDNDMDVDLYLSCAHLLRGLPNRLLENQGDGTFRAVPNAGGAEGKTDVTGWGALGAAARVAVADYDRDGFLDLMVPPTGQMLAAGEPVPAVPATPAQLFRNTGNDNHWLEVDLTGTASSADAIGARVDVSAGGVKQRRFQDGGMRHFVQDDQRLHFGLAEHARIDTLTVRWPTGHTQSFHNVEADQVVEVVEGARNLRSLSTESLTLSFAGPNPFRTSTRLRLKTAQAQHVRVDVLDALGRQVMSLYDQELDEGEMTLLRLEGEPLASGVYFVRMQGRTGVQTKKVIRLK